MKKIFLLAISLFTISIYGQTKLYDNVFIKAENIYEYDQFVKEHYAKIHNERVKNGMLLQWDVWKVVDTPQEDFTHMVTYIYDIKKYPNEAKPYEIVGMTNLQWATIQEEVNQLNKVINLNLVVIRLESTKKCCFKYHLKICKGACICNEKLKHYKKRFNESLSYIFKFPNNCKITFYENNLKTEVSILNNHIVKFGIKNKKKYI